MPPYNTRIALWDAVTALMRKNYGAENLNRLAREGKMSPATASRMKVQETSVGLDTLDKIAGVFKVPQWQLLVPDFDPDHPPVLINASALARDVAELFDKIDDEAKRQQAYALIVQMLSFGVPPAMPASRQPAESPTPVPAKDQ